MKSLDVDNSSAYQQIVTEGNAIGLEVLSKPDVIGARLNQFGYFIREQVPIDWYRDSPQRQKARYLMLRHMNRISMGLLLEGVESELAVVAEEREGSLSSLRYIESHASERERAIEGYGPFMGRNRLFLYAGAALVRDATKHFFGTVIRDRDHWAWPIVIEYSKTDSELSRMDIRRQFKHVVFGDQGPLQHVAKRITNMGIAANVTVLNTLAPAGRHAALWGVKSKGMSEAIGDKLDQLSWVSRVSTGVADYYLPTQNIAAVLPEECAFSHDEQYISKNGIWVAPRLTKAHAELARLCPAAMTFGGQTSAERRMVLGHKLANEVLWYGYDTMPEQICTAAKSESPE